MRNATIVTALLLTLVNALLGAEVLIIQDVAMLKRVEHEIATRVQLEKLQSIGVEIDPSVYPFDKSLKRYTKKELVSALKLAHITQIYTPDSRRNAAAVRASPHTTLKLNQNFDGVAAIVLTKDLRFDGNHWHLRTMSYRKKEKLCKGELFDRQPVAAICTAFLIGPNVMATAKHCYNGRKLDDTRFVFGFDGDGTFKTKFRPDDVYRGVGKTAGVVDQVTIKLSRKVLGRHPLTIDRNIISEGDELYVIGHPAGLPLKYADGAYAHSVADPKFMANLDVLGGNSGSPVFLRSSHAVVGMLINGKEGYTDIGGCNVLQECPAEIDCTGEGCLLSKYLPPVKP